MNEVRINPRGIETLFERNLRICFPHWGDAAVSRWFFDRSVGGQPADRLVMLHRGKLLAGIALTHRRLCLTTGAEVPVGILTGAWTLPEARNLGLFGRLSAEALVLGRERGLALILAFVTDDNPSSRVLARLGFAGVPARYHFATPAAASPATTPLPTLITGDGAVRELASSARASRHGAVRVTYGTDEEWSSQFLERPNPSQILQLGYDARAVVEEVGETVRIHLLLSEGEAWRSVLESLRAWCSFRQRRGFLYSTNPQLSRAAADAGWEAKAGWIRIAVADAGVLAHAAGLTSCPASADAEALVDARHPWFLGEWDIQGGDKM